MLELASGDDLANLETLELASDAELEPVMHFDGREN